MVKEQNDMQKILTFLTFQDRAEEAVRFYVSIFKNSKVLSIVRNDADGPGTKGTLLNATFQLDGQDFMAMDGGPYFSFGQGTSLFVNCETQKEVDELWDKLSEGGEKMQCGWLKDKYGVSWQIIPVALGEMMRSKNAEKSKRVMEALLKMGKLDINVLRQAYEQE
jgi:predicted 3-demethylubiquinone-9 3-methyltransferase (glyoxalase superfamily)